MKPEEYISTGILESYVLGIASPEEARKVEEYAEQYPEVAREIEEIRKAVESYAGQYKKDPPPGLKDKVVKALEALEQQSTGVSAQEPQLKEPKQIHYEPISSSKVIKWLAAAAIALLIISGGINIYLYNTLQETNDKMANLLAEKQQYAEQYDNIKTRYDLNLGLAKRSQYPHGDHERHRTSTQCTCLRLLE